MCYPVIRGEGWKTCSGCGKFRTMKCYRTSVNGKDGHRSDCKSCERARALLYSHEVRDPESHRLQAKQYRVENREKCNKQHHSWRERNRDRFNANMRRAKMLRKADKDPELFDWFNIILNDPCAYCPESSDSVEHVFPVSKGGTNDPENTVGSCIDCNRRKSDKTLLEYLLA